MMCSMESTSPGRALGAVALGAVALGTVALGAGDVAGAGAGCGAGFWALAFKQTRPRQSVTTAMSFLMRNNLPPIQRARKPRRGRRRCCSSVFPDAFTHGSFFFWMLPLPPLQVVEIAAKRNGCALYGGDGDAIVNRC